MQTLRPAPWWPIPAPTRHKQEKNTGRLSKVGTRPKPAFRFFEKNEPKLNPNPKNAITLSAGSSDESARTSPASPGWHAGGGDRSSRQPGADLAGAFPALTSLDLTRARGFLRDSHLTGLASLRALSSLSLRECQLVTPEGVRSLAALPSLTELGLGGSMQVLEQTPAVSWCPTAALCPENAWIFFARHESWADGFFNRKFRTPSSAISSPQHCSASAGLRYRTMGVSLWTCSRCGHATPMRVRCMRQCS